MPSILKWLNVGWKLLHRIIKNNHGGAPTLLTRKITATNKLYDLTAKNPNAQLDLTHKSLGELV